MKKNWAAIKNKKRYKQKKIGGFYSNKCFFLRFAQDLKLKFLKPGLLERDSNASKGS